MRLSELASRVSGRVVGEDCDVVGIRHDSRAIQSGELFAAVPGQSVDGIRFVRAAMERGAVAVLTQESALECELAQLVVSDARAALGPVSHAIYGEPTRALTTVGITGTNGKTTTSWLLDEALTKLGASPSLVGTIETRGPGIRETSTHTTPEADDLARFARSVLQQGATHLVMEVSSHALALHRVGGVRFEVAAFTNFTQDHLDFHGGMDSYFAAKRELFVSHSPERSVLFVDDPSVRRLASELNQPLTVSRLDPNADVFADQVELSRAGITARVRTPSGTFVLRSALVGGHNLDNLLVATGCLSALGYSPPAIAEALSAARGAPGRLSRVLTSLDLTVVVDYAHTPDALENVLRTLRPLTRGRLLCVFGCGGDRDRGKRPLMGAAAARGADVLFVTSDNPRTEERSSR
jgi:UDP-N-acetylmuramoyl-L-alanyl-D-glutamate--2,6-diaminopimelate ligase